MNMELQAMGPILALAELSPREEQALSLYLRGVRGPLLGREMHCKPSTAAVHLCNARRKIRKAQSAYTAAQELLAQEAADASAMADQREFYRFLLSCMRPPRHNPSGPLIGLTWVEYLYGIEVRQAMEGAIHAGPLVTVDDLMRILPIRRRAVDARQRLTGKSLD